MSKKITHDEMKKLGQEIFDDAEPFSYEKWLGNKILSYVEQQEKEFKELKNNKIEKLEESIEEQATELRELRELKKEIKRYLELISKPITVKTTMEFNEQHNLRIKLSKGDNE